MPPLLIARGSSGFCFSQKETAALIYSKPPLHERVDVYKRQNQMNMQIPVQNNLALVKGYFRKKSVLAAGIFAAILARCV